jgi:hypothetical protein
LVPIHLQAWQRVIPLVPRAREDPGETADDLLRVVPPEGAVGRREAHQIPRSPDRRVVLAGLLVPLGHRTLAGLNGLVALRAVREPDGRTGPAGRNARVAVKASGRARGRAAANAGAKDGGRTNLGANRDQALPTTGVGETLRREATAVAPHLATRAHEVDLRVEGLVP